MLARPDSTTWQVRIVDRAGAEIDRFELTGLFDPELLLDAIARTSRERGFDSDREFRVRVQDKRDGKGVWMIVADRNYAGATG